MALIGQLEVGVKADTTNFVRGMKQSKKETDSFLGSLSALKVLAVAAIGALTAGFTIASIKNTIKSIAAQKRFSDQLGISFEKLQELQFAAEQTGASTTDLNSSLQAMQRSLVIALDSTSKEAKALKQIGLTAENLLRLSMEDRFLEIGESIKKMGGQTRQAIIAQRIFGGTSKKIIGLLRSSNTEIAESIKNFRELGVTISDLDAEKITVADEKIKELLKSFTKTKNFLATELAPFVTATINRFIDFQKSRKSIDIVNEGLAITAKAVSILAAGALLVEGIFKATASAIVGVIGGVVTLLSKLAEIVEEQSKMFEPLLSLKTLLIGRGVSAFFDPGDIKELAREFKELTAGFGKSLKDESTKGFAEALKIIDAAIKEFETGAIGKKFVGDFVDQLKSVREEANRLAEIAVAARKAERESDREAGEIERLRALAAGLGIKKARETEIGAFREINTNLINIEALGRVGQKIPGKQLEEQKKQTKLLELISERLGLSPAVTSP